MAHPMSQLLVAIGLYWWPIGLLLAVAYIAFLFRLHRGKVQAAAGEDY
jgi:hypothetical protein